MSVGPNDARDELERLVGAIRRADCTIPRERALALVWTNRPDLKPMGFEPPPVSEDDEPG